MKEEYVNSFLAPAQMVWDKELGKSLSLLKAEIVSHQFTTEEVTAIIGISGSLQGTVGYGAHESFICSSCQSRGNVAAKLNCTACGEDNWWGWWPPQQQ